MVAIKNAKRDFHISTNVKHKNYIKYRIAPPGYPGSLPEKFIPDRLQFEPGSSDPESEMIDHYTTGLYGI